MWFSDNLNQADPATADWFQSIVMTERRDIDAQTSAGVQDGAALLKLARLVVYPRLDHALFTYGLYNKSSPEFPSHWEGLGEGMRSVYF